MRVPVGPLCVTVWVLVALLILGTFAAQFLRDAHAAHWAVPMLDPDEKINVPSAAKIMLLLAATALLALVGVASLNRWHRRRWLGMAVVFVILSFDEMTYFHQRLSEALHDRFNTQGVFRFAWVLIYLPIFAVLAVVYLPFWWRLPSRLRWSMLAAAILWLALLVVVLLRYLAGTSPDMVIELDA